MQITIDGKSVEITCCDRNIVEVAGRAGIGIPAPCYRSENNEGCCIVCVVEVDGEQKYACCTKPRDGMEVTVKRPDLIELRRKRATEYLRSGRKGQPCACDCSANGSSCCN